jgi:hypothetical protein
MFRADRGETDALLTDHYLDALLAARDRRADDSPADVALDPAIHRAARRLADDLDRVHPSFRFEERLASRLAEAAARLRLGLAAGAETSAIPIGPLAALDRRDDDDRAGDRFDAPTDAQTIPRPLLIGGALTSAALSLAGAAYVAWRRGRPPLSPMARAVRAAGEARLARDGSPAPRSLG